ncbi:uncharacterized protein LOC108888077 [Lates calcarifer]|uniref:Uncharacterized protein LOC108888077 n=2 Tax=Lates calcarifer TaxID=8187 RepID=A0AAJ7V7K2_LATCA|nr:uncharacterized protein LOC108888077 [Lates calcarifer]
MLWSLLLISLANICNSDNIKLTGKTNQSSTYRQDSDNYISDRAIDGNVSQCANTEQKTNSWWQIELESVRNISCIAIYNKCHQHSDITNAQIYIGNSNKTDGSDSSRCTTIKDFKQGCYNHIHCDRGVLGRFITVSLSGNSPLVLCEVRLCGSKEDICNSDNIKLTGKTNQSSTYRQDSDNYISDRAIDGNVSQCANTEEKTNSWWQIELESVRNISCIAIYNKCHQHSDITNAQIYIGNSNKTDGSDSSRCTTIKDFKQGCYNHIHCDRGVLGRFITVSLSGNSPLVLCEVRLCGSKEDSPFVLVEQKMTWADALYYCRERYTDLASILDEEDQDWAVLTAKEAQTVFVWLGLRYTCTLDFWFWVEDHHLEYNNWAPGENTQECDMSAAMMKEKDNLWFRKFDNETFNFICAK